VQLDADRRGLHEDQVNPRLPIRRADLPVGQARETCYSSIMRTITVRDLRQRWPSAEAMLEREKEIIVTRDGKPVAKLVRVPKVEEARKRFDPRGHARWQAKVGGRRTVRWVEEFLVADREAREVGASRALHRQ
jgi:antitoxin (DNA-binding transcriptional repressor) of toxin-antitoxin stability system